MRSSFFLAITFICVATCTYLGVEYGYIPKDKPYIYGLLGIFVLSIGTMWIRAIALSLRGARNVNSSSNSGIGVATDGVSSANSSPVDDAPSKNHFNSKYLSDRFTSDDQEWHQPP